MSGLALIRRTINGVLGVAGLELRRAQPAGGPSNPPRSCQEGALSHARSLGLRPTTVIDVGVASGTQSLYDSFPDAHLLLVEPLVEYTPYLEAIKRSRRSVDYVIAAATSAPGTVEINVHPDLFGSSLYLEGEASDVNGQPRSVPSVMLDDLCRERGTRGPYVIKVDVQGAELDVLRGATQVLEQTELVNLEVSLFEFFQGGPVLLDVVQFMRERGFVAYDVFDQQYRLLDGALGQIDMLFVKEHGPLRAQHSYATADQRAEHNARARKLAVREGKELGRSGD